MQNNPQNTQAPNVPGFLSANPAGGAVSAGTAENAGSAAPKKVDTAAVMKEVVQKIKDAENVLIALSNDPSVDEIAAALGLTTAIDAAGKHATAIYSGKTPNVLEFLKPEETFETNTDSLQDFIIALNKDKADHLRYKIDGDFVKVYITPYKTTISEDDLEFSRGDFNVDLVIGLNVPAATELDGALKEHGRIMNDATAVNITNGAAGKFGDVEWVNDKASSVAEMVAELAFELSKDVDAATATALLTGIVSATDKFTNQATTPEAMNLAAKLMKAGADQQEVIQNISMDLKFNERKDAEEGEAVSGDGSELSIKHATEAGAETAPEQGAGGENAEISSAGETSENTAATNAAETAGLTGALAAQMGAGADGGASSATPVDPVQAAMASAINPMGTPDANGVQTNTIAGVQVTAPAGDGTYAGGALADQMLANINGGAPGAPAEPSGAGMAPDGAQPPAEAAAAPATDYGKMIDDALAEPMPGEAGTSVPGALGAAAEPPKIVPTGGALGYESPATMGQQPAGMMAPMGQPMGEPMMGMQAGMNPALMQAPGIEGMQAPTDMPAMDYNMAGMGATAPTLSPMGQPMMAQPADMAVQPGVLPMPGQELTPPPATPTPDFGAMPPAMPQMPAVDPNMAAQPGAYQIPNGQF
ncbi:hypothetical protein IJ095_02225 [Candidatus Saccharibacteria bacterium]|nr:hypothetical protein [Candidatus Saccharibacteria bacterium]